MREDKINELSMMPHNEPVSSFASEPEPHDDLGGDAERDNEGAMAKADLFKLANYSVKLFKKIEDNDQLESWVQAKITKAADYIASVYHFLEYEMKFSEFGSKLENSEMYTESEKKELKNKLMEAKEKVKELKKLQAKKMTGEKTTKVKESWDDDDDGDEDPDVKKADRELKKKGVKLPKVKDKDVSIKKTAKDKEEEKLDEVSTATKSSYREKAGKDMSKAAKSGDKETVSKRLKGVSASLKDKKVDESSKKAKKDYDGDGKVESEKDEVWGSRMKAANKSDKKVDEARIRKPAVNFTADDINNLAKMNDLEAMKARAAELIQTPSAKPIRPEKVQHHLRNIERMNRPAEIIALMYNMLLGGEGHATIGSAHSMDKNAYRKKFDEIVPEESNPSAGLSAKKKSATVKKAKAGGDIGKKGKGFAKVEKAAKAGGAKDPKAVAAAAMWKNIKRESVKQGVRLSESHERAWELAIQNVPPEVIHDLADKLANGELSLQDFNQQIQSAAYTDYSMHRGEMGLDKLDHDEDRAWADEKGDWDDLDDREREWDDEMDETSDEENDIISAPQPAPVPPTTDPDGGSAPRMYESLELGRIKMLSGLN